MVSTHEMLQHRLTYFVVIDKVAAEASKPTVAKEGANPATQQSAQQV